MKLEEALKTAIEYETKVRDVYINAMKQEKDEKAKHFFGVMAKEEQYHLNYLGKRLDEFQKTGDIHPEELQTVVPPREKINDEIRKLKEIMDHEDHSAELDILHKALDLETETGNFYKKMADELEGQGKKMFTDFLSVEEAHRHLVLTEIDCLNGTGFWFHLREFNLEVY